MCDPLADNNLLEFFADTTRLRARKKPHVRYALGSFTSYTISLLSATRSALRRRVQPELAR